MSKNIEQAKAEAAAARNKIDGTRAGSAAGIDLADEQCDIAIAKALFQRALDLKLLVSEVSTDTTGHRAWGRALIRTGAALARATPQPDPAPTFPEVQAEEAKLYRDLTGDAMALGFDGIVAALEALRATPQPSADRAPAPAAAVRAAERIDAMHKGVVGVFATIKAEHEATSGADRAPADGAVYQYRHEHRLYGWWRETTPEHIEQLRQRSGFEYRTLYTAAPADGADELVYQVRMPGASASTWNDATEAAYHTFTDAHRRIVYAHRAPTAGDSATPQPAAKNPHNDYLAPYWQAGYDGKEIDATMQGHPLAAYADGIKAATPQHSVAEHALPTIPRAADVEEALERYGTGVLPWSCRIPANQPLNVIADAMQWELNDLRPLVKAARAQPLASTAATQPEQVDEVRAQFETWMTRHGHSLVSRLETGGKVYESSFTRQAWATWQKDAALAIPASTARIQPKGGE